MKVAALLTARAGSKSVPNKNLILHKGIPLYAHNVKNAAKSEMIEKLYISTDSPEIIEACKKTKNNKINLIVRPKNLCQDNSSHYDTIMHGFEVIEKENGHVDFLVVLLGNTPHAYTTELDSAIDNFIFEQDRFDSCMSVSKFNMFNPYRAVHKLDNGTVVPIINPKITTFMSNRKSANDKDAFGDVYFFNGSFWIIKRETLFKNDGDFVFPWLGKRIMPFVQKDGYQEIDAEWQLRVLQGE